MAAESSDWKSFIVNNNILTTMAGVTIAFSTGIMIRSLVGDIILPTIYSIYHSLREIPIVGGFSAFAPINAMNFDNFLKEVLTWVIVVFVTYIFIAIIMKRYVLAEQTAAAEQEKQKQQEVTTTSNNNIPKPKKVDDTSSGAAVVIGAEGGEVENFYNIEPFHVSRIPGHYW